MFVKHEPQNRAVQFSAFDALKGYGEMIENALFVPELPPEPTEEEADKINREISNLKIGDCLDITYFLFDRYARSTDKISDIDPAISALKLGKTWIDFSRIKRIKRL